MSFLGKSDDKNIRLSNAHKYVETLVFNVKLISCKTSNSCTYSVMIIYDTWAEKARNEKENSKEIEL